MTTTLSDRLAGVRDRTDAGIALIGVLMVLVLLTGFSAVMLTQTVRDAGASKRNQDWNAALSAAQAGVEDYVSRLNQSDGAYYVYTTAAPDSLNLAMGTTSGKPRWAPVAQVDAAAARSSFHYDVDNSSYVGSGSNGVLAVSSTGRVGTKTRTVQARVRRSGFVDFVYFTDFETEDPDLYHADPSCADHYYQDRDSHCTNIQFANDTLTGPVHSNDTILICDHADFNDHVTTMSTYDGGSGRHFRHNLSGCDNTGTTFQYAAEPRTVPKITMPATNATLKAWTDASASPRGCLYVGPTKVVIKGNQLMVTSPWTRTPTPGCTVGSWMSLPGNGVLYVDDVPADGTSDINAWPTASGGSKPACSTPSNNVGYPIANEDGWSYGCRTGDVFIEEQNGDIVNALNGRMTVAAKHDLYVTDHIDYSGGTGGSSFLGLIAENFVYYWHPVDGSHNLPSDAHPTFEDARISAALLSVNHSVTTMNNDRGADLGLLNITGSITQKYRGIVKSGNAGYSKNYVYDNRLRYDCPPHFLSPVNSTFVRQRTAELPPAYPAS